MVPKLFTHTKKIQPIQYKLLKTLLPELVALQTVTEQSDWHNDTPFRQSVRLRQWVVELPFSTSDLQLMIDDSSLTRQLAVRVDTESGAYTMHKLLKFAALIHDVGKKETFTLDDDGTTRCPGHETAGARMTPTICARFDFTSLETNFITTLVRDHGEPYTLYKDIAELSPADQEQRIHCFERAHTGHLLPLLLLACGDLVTSHLQEIRPEKYEPVLNFYRNWLGGVLGYVSLYQSNG